MATPGGLVDKQELIDAQLDTAHLGRVVNSKDASGNPIDTSTNRTGGVNKTLDALETEYLEAIQGAGGIPIGTWTAGVTTFNAYNEYAVYSGIPYKPRTSATLPYVAQGADPTAAPDDANVQPYQEITIDTVRSFTSLVYRKAGVLSAVDRMIQGDPVVATIGDICSTGGTSWERVSDSNGDITDFKPLTELFVGDFGFFGNSPLDNTNAIKLAIEASLASNPKGGKVRIPIGNWELSPQTALDGYGNGLFIPPNGGAQNNVFNTVEIIGEGLTTKILAGGDNMCIARISASHCKISNLTLDANGYDNVIGLGLIPEDLTDLANFANQSYNKIKELFIRDCTEGILFQCGPGAGSTSACYYNTLRDIHIDGKGDGSRGIYLKTGVSVAPFSSNNRNNFYDVHINSVNTGIEIESGDTNNFYGVSFESIGSGTTPNSTATGLVIKASDGNGEVVQSNRFFGSKFEGVTRHIENASTTTELFGVDYDGTKVLFTSLPMMSVGGYLAANCPQILQGMVFQNNAILPGFKTGSINPTNGIAFSDTQDVFNYYDEGTWIPEIKGSVSDPTVTYGNRVARYTRTGNIVYCSIDISTISLSGGDGTFEIDGLPFPPIVSSGYNPYFAVGYSGGFAVNNPRAGRVVGSTGRMQFFDSNSSDFQTGATTSALLVSELNTGSGNRMGFSFFYETA